MKLAQANVRELNPSKICLLQELIFSFQLEIVCITY